jgi:pimeloyl-ACP methyl ester carboxylesterase
LKGRPGTRARPVKRALRRPAPILAALAVLLVFPGYAEARSRQVVSQEVSFAVRNTNTSAVSCRADGAAYTIKGHLVAPSALLARPARRRTVTLYLHGWSFGEWLWNFSSVPGYNYAQIEARSGHASVVIDRIGYGASSRPDGSQICLGSQADVAHQIVGQLRSGSYTGGQAPPPAFGRVALAGHSIGGLVASIEAASFRDVNLLVVAAYSDDASQTARTTYGRPFNLCRSGGEPVAGGALGYAHFDQSPDAFKALMFHSGTPAVLNAAATLRTPDPCGDILSAPIALARQPALLPKIKVPVLVICGKKDLLFVVCRNQRKRYTRSRDTSLVLVPGAGHALTLDRNAGVFRRKIGTWLRRRGF